MTGAANSSEEIIELRRRLESAARRLGEALADYQMAGGAFIDRAGPISEQAVADCRVHADRYELLKHLPKNGNVAEIGTDKAAFARYILDTCSPTKLHIYELDTSRIDWSNIRDALDHGRCDVWHGDSVAGLSTVPDGYFDWVYIDGDHSYEGVARDIAAAIPKVKQEGLIVFNDYCVWSVSSMRRCGVARAVNELIRDTGWKMERLALQTSGYFDVVVRKGASSSPSVGSFTEQTMGAPIPAASTGIDRAANRLIERGERDFKRFAQLHRRHANVEPAGRLLDYGCGAGAFVAAAHKNGLKAFGVDVTLARQAQFQSILRATSLPDDRLIRYDGTRLPFSDGSFDIVYSWFVLEHVPNAKQSIAEIARVLRVGGYVYLFADDALNGWDGHARIPWPPFLPRALSRYYLEEFGLHDRAEFIENEVFYVTSDEVVEALQEKGFDILHRNHPSSGHTLNGREIHSETAAREAARVLRARFEAGEITSPSENLTVFARRRV